MLPMLVVIDPMCSPVDAVAISLENNADGMWDDGEMFR